LVFTKGRGFAKIAFGDLIAAVPRLKLWLALLAQSKQSQKPKQSKAKNPSLFLLV
jgi:hypothetical protein